MTRVMLTVHACAWLLPPENLRASQRCSLSGLEGLLRWCEKVESQVFALLPSGQNRIVR